MLPTFEEMYKDIDARTLGLGQKALQTHKDILEAFKQKDAAKLDTVLNEVKGVADEANDIDNNIVKIFALYEPEASILRELIAILKITNEIVKVANRAKSYAKTLKTHIINGFNFSMIENYIIELHNCAIKAFEAAISWDTCGDYEECFLKAKTEESKSDDIYSVLQKELFSLLKTMDEFTEESIKLINGVKKLERVGDHAETIAELMLFAKKGGKINIKL